MCLTYKAACVTRGLNEDDTECLDSPATTALRETVLESCMVHGAEVLRRQVLCGSFHLPLPLPPRDGDEGHLTTVGGRKQLTVNPTSKPGAAARAWIVPPPLRRTTTKTEFYKSDEFAIANRSTV